MLEVKNTAESVEINLALPENGFATDLLDALSVICSEHSKELVESYLVLKKEGEDVSLLLGILFLEDLSKLKQESVTKSIVMKAVELFSDDISIDAMSLNNHDQLKKVISSMSTPFYVSVSS